MGTKRDCHLPQPVGEELRPSPPRPLYQVPWVTLLSRKVPLQSRIMVSSCDSLQWNQYKCEPDYFSFNVSQSLAIRPPNPNTFPAKKPCMSKPWKKLFFKNTFFLSKATDSDSIAAMCYVPASIRMAYISSCFLHILVCVQNVTELYFRISQRASWKFRPLGLSPDLAGWGPWGEREAAMCRVSMQS